MSIEQAKSYLAQFGRDKDVMEFPVSSATVDLAAEALQVIPARITKTLAFQGENGCILIGMAGDAKVDNKKFKAFFAKKQKCFRRKKRWRPRGMPSAAYAVLASQRRSPVTLTFLCSGLTPSFPPAAAAIQPSS